MNAEAQRIAIAEACGWKTTSDSPNWAYYRPDGRGWNGELPDYLADLNAMHFAEQSIRRDHDVYGLYLTHLNRTAPECRVHATPAQKAEAFLRAIGKWEGGK